MADTQLLINFSDIDVSAHFLTHAHTVQTYCFSDISFSTDFWNVMKEGVESAPEMSCVLGRPQAMSYYRRL
jgi:hypothetical protein